MCLSPCPPEARRPPIVPDLEICEAVELKWASQVGVNYQVQHSPDMKSWFNDGAPIGGTGSDLSALRSKDSERKYYRVGLLAPSLVRYRAPFGADLVGASRCMH